MVPDGLTRAARPKRTSRTASAGVRGPGQPAPRQRRPAPRCPCPGCDTILTSGSTTRDPRPRGAHREPQVRGQRTGPVRGHVPGLRGHRRRARGPWLSCARRSRPWFRSWNSDRARTYRRSEGSRRPRTAVTCGMGSATERGTRAPACCSPQARPPARRSVGDVMFKAQGEDVAPHLPDGAVASWTADAEIGLSCASTRMRLERHNARPCDIVFTIEHAAVDAAVPGREALPAGP